MSRSAPPAAASAAALATALAALFAPAVGVAQLRPADPAFWTVVAAALAGSAVGDPWLRRELHRPGAPIVQTIARDVQPLGLARTALIGLGGSFATAELSRQPEWARATLRVAAGYVAADAVTSVLKPVVGRARPYAALGAYHFRAFASTDREHSFASGHATHAFALAAGVADEARRPWVTTVVYSTAALVGWSRIHDDAHWTSDVVAGAVVGMAASRTARAWLDRLAHRRRRPAPADTSRTAPDAGRDGPPRLSLGPRGVAVRLTF